MIRRHLWVVIAVLSSSLLAACSSSPGPVSTSTRAVSSTTAGSSGKTSSAVENLTVSGAVRAQLLSVGAQFHGAPVSQYSGLAPGLTYYAFDRTTGIFWAGAKLVPKVPSNPNGPPTQAEVSSQDEGSYTVFMKSESGSWHPYDTGETGPDTQCPVTVPPAVLQVWGWSPGSCRPSGA